MKKDFSPRICGGMGVGEGGVGGDEDEVVDKVRGWGYVRIW